MKLYLDDIRNPHQSGYNNSEWIVCRNDKTFKDMFESFDSIITHISFDSDGNEVTGYDCVKWLCDYIQDNSLDISNLTLNFHTANPVGRVNMEGYWNNFKNYYFSTYLKEWLCLRISFKLSIMKMNQSYIMYRRNEYVK